MDGGEIVAGEPRGAKAQFGKPRRVAGDGVLETLPGHYRSGLAFIKDDGHLSVPGLRTRGKIRRDFHHGIESPYEQRANRIGRVDPPDEPLGLALPDQIRRKRPSYDRHARRHRLSLMPLPFGEIGDPEGHYGHQDDRQHQGPDQRTAVPQRLEHLFEKDGEDQVGGRAHRSEKRIGTTLTMKMAARITPMTARDTLGGDTSSSGPG